MSYILDIMIISEIKVFSYFSTTMYDKCDYFEKPYYIYNIIIN